MPALRPQTQKWTRAEYYRMADLGLFRDQRVELIEGIEVRRNPVPDAGEHYGWRSQDVLLLGPQDRIAPLAAPKKHIAAADLLP